MRTHVPFDRLTASDMFLLLWDDYGWRSDIGGLAVLDGSGLLDPGGRVSIEDVNQRLQARLHLVPLFRQLLYRPRPGLGWPLWVDAPTFDIAQHVRVHQLEAGVGRIGEAELLAACAQLTQRPMDPTRPLWELWLMPVMPDDRVGAYVKLHHDVADGAPRWPPSPPCSTSRRKPQPPRRHTCGLQSQSRRPRGRHRPLTLRNGESGPGLI